MTRWFCNCLFQRCIGLGAYNETDTPGLTPNNEDFILISFFCWKRQKNMIIIIIASTYDGVIHWSLWGNIYKPSGFYCFIKDLCNHNFLSFFTLVYDMLKFKMFKTEDEARFHSCWVHYLIILRLTDDWMFSYDRVAFRLR